MTGKGPRPARVAVLFPARNAAETLAEALDSLLAQSFVDFRVLAVDDGSTDGSLGILRQFAERDPRVEVLDRPGSSGNIPAALVAAADHATEPLLARMDADDRCHPERLARQVAYLDQHPEVGVLATDVEWSGHATPTDGARRYADWLSACRTPDEITRNLWIESPLPHPTVLMRREAYLAAGGYRDLGWPEDYDLWLRMAALGVRMAKLSEPLLAWRDNPNRASRRLPAYSPEAFLRCRCHHLARHLAGRPIVVWGAGRDGRRAARQLLREGVAVVAFLDIDPKKIGRKAHGYPVLEAESWLRTRTPNGIVLAAVGTSGARDLIRARLTAAGLVEGPEFLCIA